MKRIMKICKRRAAGLLAFFLIAACVFGSGTVFAAKTGQATRQGAPGTGEIDTIIEAVKEQMLTADPSPDEGSIWNIIGLVRGEADIPASYKDTSYANVLSYLREKDWNVTKVKYTDYSKLILYFTVLGKDARNIEGHNMLSYLSDFENVTRQGYNGPVWALIALKSNPAYRIPADSSAKKQTTEELLVSYLLDSQLPGGGWTLAGDKADTDITAMTVQALASYYGKREDVTEAISRALDWLSQNQFVSGGFGTLSPGSDSLIETSESICQAVVALSAIGIDCGKDSRFIKDGNSAIDALLSYYLPERGGFMHIKPGSSNNGGGTGGTFNEMATEQGLYAIAAYKRFLAGKNPLYEMSEFSFPADDSGAGTTATNSQGSTAPADGSSVGTTATNSPGSTADGNKPSPNTPKTKKLGLKQSHSTTSSVTLQWNKLSGIDGYRIFCYNQAKKKYEKVADAAASKTSYTMKRLNGTKGKKLASGTAYKIRAAAYTVTGKSVAYKSAQTITAVTKPDKPSIKVSRRSSTKAKISWKKVKGSNGYEIYMSYSKKGGYKKIKTIGKGSATSYTKAKLRKGKAVYFKVRAVKKAGSTRVYGGFSAVKQMK